MRDPEGLLDELQAGISELTTSERWQRYLDVQSRFYSYSPNNVMLIALQKPNATRVAGYKTWQSLDHQVRAKESALRILAPMRYQKDDGPEGENVREVHGFKLVPVFDVSQTDGPDLPEAVSRLEGLAPEGVFERLTEFAHGIGFRVERPESLVSGANGDTTHASGVIRVVSANSEAQQAKTLAHEIAHALLHDPESVTTKDLSRGLKELEAESAAYVICTALGMDTSDYSFGYVLGWTGGAPDAIEGIRASTGRIQRAATAVLKTFEVEKSTAEVANRLDNETTHAADRRVDARVERDVVHGSSKGSAETTEESRVDLTSSEVLARNYRPISSHELDEFDSFAVVNHDLEI
ncbi:MAG: ImmA/IrrE family metallo-endopeptidase [Acidobacteria bacterium]|nr:ImmA/IrrE family metallo-endopeptidase [Acidobacteriota bacterium]